MNGNAGPERPSSFAPAFFFLPPRKREALAAVYGFCRAVDDAVDEPGSSDPRESINFWRQELDRLYSGAPSHPVTKRLAGPVTQFGLEKENFALLIEGMEHDIGPVRCKTFAELEWYMFRAASAPGLLCARIFGYRHAERAREYARLLGYAVQLTNIIRDVAEDARLDRIYLPLEDLGGFGLSENDILNGTRRERLAAALEREAARAREFYSLAAAALDPQDRASMLPAAVMGGIYGALLDKISRRGFNVLEGKIRLNPAEKAFAVLGAIRRAL
ncbi:MAG: squalene/phytoene synthase family protein [Elusimicrobiales bacterium]